MSNFTNFTDEELNRNWTPSGRRPQSTIAQSFSAELENLFRIDNSAVDLDNQVDKRRRVVSLQTEELEALEARLREIQNLEARIRGDDVSASSSAASSASGSPTTATAAAKAAQNQRDAAKHVNSSHSMNVVVDGHYKSPGTGRVSAPSAGDMPPSPEASDAEY